MPLDPEVVASRLSTHAGSIVADANWLAVEVRELRTTAIRQQDTIVAKDAQLVVAREQNDALAALLEEADEEHAALIRAYKTTVKVLAKQVAAQQLAQRRFENAMARVNALNVELAYAKLAADQSRAGIVTLMRGDRERRERLRLAARHKDAEIEVLRERLRYESSAATPDDEHGEFDSLVLGFARSLGEAVGYAACGDWENWKGATAFSKHYLDQLAQHSSEHPLPFSGALVQVRTQTRAIAGKALFLSGCQTFCMAHDPTVFLDPTCPVTIAHARLMAALWSGYCRAARQARAHREHEEPARYRASQSEEPALPDSETILLQKAS